MLRKNYLHVETTTRCTLKCPACPRTVWQDLIKQPIKKTDINLDDLKNFINCKSGEDFETMNLCGDYGDTIYYPELFRMIKLFRHKAFKIHTNGSYKSKEWWAELNNLLTEKDIIIFGIDGLQEDNVKYRVNANWKSIETAIDQLSKGPARLRCKTLIFDFNHTKLDEIQQWAENKGMEWFSLQTMRFGNNKLMPQDKTLINTQERYKEEFSHNNPIEINPKCLKSCVVTADGYFMPCDWIRNPLTFYKSELYLEKKKWIDRLKISDITLDDAFGILEEWMENVKQKGRAGQAEVLCKMKCRAC
jgi:MoaA/NifB/PqqE/SkfB family radical SAM enzyme